MKRLLLAVLAVGLLAQPSQVSGQLYYNGIPDDTEYLNFLGGSGVSSGGVQVGPYTGSFRSDPTQVFNIYCVDYNHTARSQNVWVTSITPPSDLDDTRLDSYSRYRTAAYLSSLFHTATPTTYSTQAAYWGAIHRAIWSVTSAPQPNSWDDFLTYARRQEASNYNTEGWYVVSPRGSANGQEFLMRVRQVSVPEPATFLLLASGLLMLAAVSRKRLGLNEGDA